MFSPILLFFFGQGEQFGEWTVYLPAATAWGLEDADIATVIEVQE